MERVEQELEQVLDDVTRGSRRAAARRIGLTVAGIAVLIGLACVWLFTPLRGWLDLAQLTTHLARLRESPYAPLGMLLAFVAGGLLIVPVNLLIAACVLVFGPWLGALYALIGTELSAAIVYEIGRHLPARTLREHLGARVQALKSRLLRYGVLAVAVVRIVPVAPYSVVNLVAGAAHVPRLPYLLGTALGMTPGIVFNAVFIDRVVAAVQHPGPTTYALLALAAAIVLLLVLLLRRRVLHAASVRRT